MLAALSNWLSHDKWLSNPPARAQSAGMKTLTKPARTKSARKPAMRRVTLTPPPGKSAREVMAHYPEPSPDFDADFVEKVVAARADR